MSAFESVYFGLIGNGGIPLLSLQLGGLKTGQKQRHSDFWWRQFTNTAAFNRYKIINTLLFL